MEVKYVNSRYGGYPQYELDQQVILADTLYTIIGIAYDWQGWRYTLLGGLHVYEKHLKSLTMSTNIFEEGTRRNLGFSTIRGTIGISDLWQLPLQNGAINLDAIAIELDSELKKETVSFVNTATVENHIKQLKFDIVKHIIDVKITEADEQTRLVAKQAKREQILALIADKQNTELSQKSIDELTAELAAL